MYLLDKRRRSAFADMLHDTERNQKYYAGLQEAVHLMHKRGQPAIVLDIGTGTGLLSMMAVECGADLVTACEAFKPMAACAKQVIADNGFTDKIKLIPKRSTDLKVGPDGDMEQKANILVTEVFDTELIGEGALPTFHHALRELLEKHCIVVPSIANLYIQVVHSEFARQWNKFQPIKIDGCDDVIPPREVTECPGVPSVHDLQLDQVSPDQFQPITEPLEVFRFDFTGQGPIEFHRYKKVATKSQGEGSVDAVFMWWEIQMDTRGDIMLSCAPSWAHPNISEMQWRDHWMQAVYYPQTQLSVDKGDSIVVHCCHDDYSLWFDVTKGNDVPEHRMPEVPACRCGAHVSCSRTRIGMLHNTERNQKYVDTLSQVITPETVCLCRSDGSLLPLVAARLGAKQVYTIEPNTMTRRLLQRYIEANDLESKVKVISHKPDAVELEHLENGKVTLLLGEPQFTSSTLPWHNIHFWYARTELAKVLADKPIVCPASATMRAIGVELKDLWKIRSPVGNCEGFDLTTFDKLIMAASDLVDDAVEPQPLWEYPAKPMTEPFGLLRFDFTQPLAGIKTVERKGVFELTSVGTCHGVAVWMEYHLDKSHTISTGLQSPPEHGKPLQWDIHTRQGIHLFKNPAKVTEEQLAPPVENGHPNEKPRLTKLKYKVVFKPKTGEFDFSFSTFR